VVFGHEARKIVGSVVLNDEDMRSASPLEIKLVPAGTLTGRLVDDDGLPWAGAKLHFSTLDQDGRNFPESNGMIVADAEGRFRVEGFVPGVQTLLFLEAGDRPNVFLDGGEALGKPALSLGEVRDLGDVKAKVKPQ